MIRSLPRSRKPFSLASSKVGCIASKALLISVDSSPTGLPWSIACFQSSTKRTNVVSQLYILRYADIKGSKIV